MIVIFILKIIVMQNKKFLKKSKFTNESVRIEITCKTKQLLKGDHRFTTLTLIHAVGIALFRIKKKYFGPQFHF